MEDEHGTAAGGQSRADAFDPHDCPEGVSFARTQGGFVAEARLRNPKGMKLLLAMSLLSLAAANVFYQAIILHLVLGVIFTVGGFLLVLSPVLLPVLAIPFGTVSVIRDGNHGRVRYRYGIGAIGWTRKFLWHDLSEVRERPNKSRISKVLGGSLSEIAVDGKTRFSFGHLLPPERRQYLLALMQAQLGAKPMPSVVTR